MWRIGACFGSLVFLVSCAEPLGEDPLAEKSVLSIGPGDGVQQIERMFEAELLIVRCDGLCGVIEVSEDLVVSTCDVGLREEIEIGLVFDAGTATMDLGGSERLSRLDGGAFLDGSFDVGGVRSVGGGATSFRRFRGRVSGELDEPEDWTIQTAIDVVAYADPCVATYELVLP